MAINITKINRTSPETKSAIQRKSAQSLPNNPSERGFSAEDIKRRFYQPIIDATNSAIAEVDRIADETNNALNDVGAQVDAYIDNTQIKEAYRIVFNNGNWKYNEELGMYEIFISNTEHGIDDYEKIGVDMFLLDGSGTYIPVNQYEVQLDGTVRCYHESNGAGHVSVYEKREGIIITQGVVDVNNVVGLAKVAQTNNYNDLDNVPNNNLPKSNELKIAEILSGIREVGKAQQADNATNAVYAQNCDSATNASNAASATKASQDSDGNVIKNTYAKQNGTYSGMSVGSATRASQDEAGINIVKSYAKKDGSYENMSVGRATIASYASEDTSKGTIEERLTNLGFKQGNIGILGGPTVTTNANKVTRQGDYVIANFDVQFTNKLNANEAVITYLFINGVGIVKNYEDLKGHVAIFYNNEGEETTHQIVKEFSFDSNYSIQIPHPLYPLTTNVKVSRIRILNFGYRAEPLT